MAGIPIVFSGQAAITYSILNILGGLMKLSLPAAYVVAHIALFVHTFSKFGIKVHFVDIDTRLCWREK